MNEHLVLDILYWIIAVVFCYVFWPCWAAVFTKWDEDSSSEDNETEWPHVSVIVPARNEGRAIRDCLSSLARQDYPSFEVIIVDDRSEDSTGEIARSFAARDPRFRYIRVDELPPGWLGKNHANHLGSRAATGQFLLFTDADVVFGTQALRTAVRHMQQHSLDHLTLLPGSPPLSLLESAAMVYFAALFVAVTRAGVTRWYRYGYAGVGAFNMVRRDAYQKIGGHERLRLEVVDDVMLGWLIKQHGFRQDARPAFELVKVRWQYGLKGIVTGLEKNAFAGLGYSIPRLLLGVGFQLLSFVLSLPVIALMGPRTPVVLVTLLSLLTFGAVSVRFTGSPVAGFLFPVGAVTFVVALVRSALRALLSGAIHWRDTAYSLAELKAFRAGLERDARLRQV